EEGIAQIRQGLAAYRDTGAQSGRSLVLGLLAETYKNTARPEEGLTVVTEALTLVQNTGQRSQESWLWRIKGELLLNAERMANGEEARPKRNDELKTSSVHRSSFRIHRSAEAEAEACFHKALDIARRQNAKSLELRAAVSLGRLWRQQGKKGEARRLLAEIYGWFTEGFDTPHLQDARALLQELGD
ncbi:MAG TPA: hypothetical protein VGX03_23235, partial [Candidatus Binatia bacterium]|nr:hypothetical protein [Candidatus Binatia bacterium]